MLASLNHRAHVEVLYKHTEINIFIQQGCIKLTKSDSEDIYNVMKKNYISSKFSNSISIWKSTSQLMLFIITFYSSSNPEKKYHGNYLAK